MTRPHGGTEKWNAEPVVAKTIEAIQADVDYLASKRCEVQTTTRVHPAAMLKLDNADPEIQKLFTQIRAAMLHRPFAREVAMGAGLYKAFVEWCSGRIQRIDGMRVVMDPDLVSFVVR